MGEKSLRVGIVGCGQIARESHIPALRKSKGVEIVAVCDTNKDLAIRVANKLKISRAYDNFTEMLRNEQPDVVNICTPPNTHSSLCIQAAEAGCHILVEKPMAPTAGDCEEMITAARNNQVSLGVVHNELFKPVVVAAISIVRRGDIGDLTGIAIQFSRGKDDDWIVNKDHWCHKLPGGIFCDMLPHTIYLALELLGGLEPVAVETRKFGGYGWMQIDELYMILKGANGLGTVISSCNWPKETAIMDIFGTKISLHVDIYNAVLTKYGRWGSSRPSRAIENISQSLQQVVCILSTATKKVLGRYHTGDYIYIHKFIESIRNDTLPPVTGEDGREVMRVFEKIVDKIEKPGPTV